MDSRDVESLIEPEWLAWYRLTPAQRMSESEKLWQHYLEIGGSLDPEPDAESPFFDPADPGTPEPEGWQAFLDNWRRESLPLWRMMCESVGRGETIHRAWGDDHGREA